MLSGSHVLIADDDPDVLAAVAESLEQLDANVVRANSGTELIDRLADSGPFDLVVTDVAMPWMTGVSAMRAARTAGLRMPTIVMTALSDETIPAAVKRLGQDVTLLRKPFEIHELESMAEKLLANRRPDVAD
jgi:two-component system, cell cycle sensor histidine kinase and response regulator CckA